MLSQKREYEAEMRTEGFSYYVLVLNTFKSIVEFSLWQSLLLVDPDVSRSDGLSHSVISDWDWLVLYQNAFEAAHTLCCAENKQKVLAVYFLLLDIPPHAGSNAPVSLEKKDFKEFGHDNVLSEHLIILKVLQENGKQHCFAGDNHRLSLYWEF